MKKILIALLAFSSVAHAQNTYRSYLKDITTYREHALDITRMKVDVSFEPTKGLVKGKVTHTFTVLQKQVDSVFFDAPGIQIKSAQLGTQTLAFNKTDKGVWVIPSKPCNGINRIPFRLSTKLHHAKAFILLAGMCPKIQPKIHLRYANKYGPKDKV